MELAPCGLDCNACGLKGGNCDRCHADSDHLWSPDCEIRMCCKFKMNHSNCSECDSFPCQLILDFENDEHIHHTDAVQKLRNLHSE